jgi:hypothetical protein
MTRPNPVSKSAVALLAMMISVSLRVMDKLLKRAT